MNQICNCKREIEWNSPSQTDMQIVSIDDETLANSIRESTQQRGKKTTKTKDWSLSQKKTLTQSGS